MGSSFKLSCRSCGQEAEQDRPGYTCLKCGGVLEYSFDPEYLKEVKFEGPISFWRYRPEGPISFWRYRPVLPPVKEAVSLGEGGTPLWVSERLGSDLELENLKLKDETRNPTSSFKDRSASLIVSDAVGRGFDTLVSATSGNHGASLAAYSAKEGLTCHLIVPSNMDIGKLAQMIAYDAEVDTAGDNIEHAISHGQRSDIPCSLEGFQRARGDGHVGENAEAHRCPSGGMLSNHRRVQPRRCEPLEA
jgi:threonine synthase